MRSTLALAIVLVAATACIGSSPFEPWPGGPKPTLTSIQPSTASVGDQIVITGTGFTPDGNSVRIGAGYINKLPSSDATTIRLTLPSYLGVCPPDQEVCVALALQMAPGDYRVSVITANGTSNDVAFRVVAK